MSPRRRVAMVDRRPGHVEQDFGRFEIAVGKFDAYAANQRLNSSADMHPHHPKVARTSPNTTASRVRVGAKPSPRRSRPGESSRSTASCRLDQDHDRAGRIRKEPQFPVRLGAIVLVSRANVRPGLAGELLLQLSNVQNFGEMLLRSRHRPQVPISRTKTIAADRTNLAARLCLCPSITTRPRNL